MKKSLLLLLAVVCMAAVFAQAPQSIPYQAVARDSFDTPIPDQAMQARISIRNLTSTGTIVYRETDTFTTSSMGLFTINIGQGTVVSGTFSSIPWGTGAKFLQVELDPTGGSTYVDLGASQLLSVPYALFAGGAESSGPAANGLHTDSGTIKLGGPLTDSVTLITIPFGKSIVFSPDSTGITDENFTGFGVAKLDMDGDTILGISAKANYIGIDAQLTVDINANNSLASMHATIIGDTAHFSENCRSDVNVMHLNDSGEPFAFAGLYNRPIGSVVMARGYTGVESGVNVDTNSINIKADNNINVMARNSSLTYGAMLQIQQDTITGRPSSRLSSNNPDYISSITAKPDEIYITVGPGNGAYSENIVNVDTQSVNVFAKKNINISTHPFTTSYRAAMEIEQDTVTGRPNSQLISQNPAYSSYIRSEPDVIYQGVSSGNGSSLYSYSSLDTSKFHISLRNGVGLTLFEDNFAINNSGNQPLFRVDTFGAVSTTAFTTGFTYKTSAYTLTNSDYTVNCTSGSFNLTLPDAAGIMGRTYVLNNSGSGTITINTTSSQTIDGHASGYYTLAQWHNYIVQSDGGNWIILSAK